MSAPRPANTSAPRRTSSRRPTRTKSHQVDANLASDRSPLQKVETIVNGMREEMSKEDKRAQLMMVEEKLAIDRRDSVGKARSYGDGDAYRDYSVAGPSSSRPIRGTYSSNATATTTTTTADRGYNNNNINIINNEGGRPAAAVDAGMNAAARARLYEQASPHPTSTPGEQHYPATRTDSRRRSEGAPRVLTKPAPQDHRASSASYAQGAPPQRQRSVREGRVFDTDPGFVDSYDERSRHVGQSNGSVRGYDESNGSYMDLDGSPRSAKDSSGGGMLGRVKSMFKRKRASQPPPARDTYYDEKYEPQAQSPVILPQAQQRDHRFFHHDDPRRYEQPRYEDYRKNVRTANVDTVDPDPQVPIAAVAPPVPPKDDPTIPWWEKSPRNQSTPASVSRRRSAGPGPAAPSAAATTQSPPIGSLPPQPVDGPRDSYQSRQQPQPTQQQTYFQPQLYLRCGPLLRFTGLRKSSRNPDREVWTGSIMIVSVDSKSRYEPAPNLRIFKQPIELLPLPPQHIDEASGQQLPPEYVDPIAGAVKMSRVGKTLYVKPVEALDEKRDLSRVEDDSGLFEEFRSPTYERPTGKGTTGGLRPVGQDGELRGRFQDITAYVLHKERGVTFWKWNLEIELSSTQVRLAYRINRGPALGFWIPARGQTMNMMFHSCNGFSLSVNADDFSGPDPLWRDVLNTHQTRPFHVMLGGGDQIYMDAATVQTKLFGAWSQMKHPHEKNDIPFSREMQEEMEKFFLNRYAMWFSQGLFGLANSTIPMVNMWDDHDIIDGFGSYPDHTMRSPVMSGVGNVAFKYYMLFQHQSLPIEDERTEPSWLLGARRGPYVTELSRSLFMKLGHKTALLALDCRTERMRDEIMTQETYDLVFERLRKEIRKGETQHLIVILGVPIAYPRLNFLENVLTSRAMDPVKALGRTGALGGFVNKFDGGVEILDDLDDHWTAKHHKDERNWFIQELQELAADLSVRVSILSGDVHLGAVGQFYSNKILGLPKDQDHRYMPNIISSAIVNTPPADMVADVLNKRNKIHHLDEDTDEDMMPMFPEDVNNKSRNNQHLLPRRNWCSIREYKPELTPPPSRSPSPSTTAGGSIKRRGSLTRTLSGSKLPGAGLIRRLSQRGSKAPPVAFNQHPSTHQRRSSYDAPRRQSADVERGSYPGPASEGDLSRTQRPSPFMRRPTVMLPNNPTHMINLRGGLDIRLNCENERGDPAGTTTEYRLIVPALDYRGDGDPNPEAVKKKGRFSQMVRGFSQRKVSNQGSARGYEDYSEESFEQHNRPVGAQPGRRFDGNGSWDSLQEDVPAPLPAQKRDDYRNSQAMQQEQSRSRRSEVPDVPLPPSATGVQIGPNGLPVRNKSKIAANTSAPATSGQGMSMRRQDLPATHRYSIDDPSTNTSLGKRLLQPELQQPQGTARPDTYAGPNTLIPENLPPPPSVPPPGPSHSRASVSEARRIATERKEYASQQGRRASEGKSKAVGGEAGYFG